jgi:hypothetical protein
LLAAVDIVSSPQLKDDEQRGVRCTAALRALQGQRRLGATRLQLRSCDRQNDA